MKGIVDEGFATVDSVQAVDTKVDTVDERVATHMADLSYQKASETATAITLNMQPLVDGYAKTFISSANNGGAASKIKRKPLYKPNTTTAPTLIAGKANTFWYDLADDCFFLKASAEGTATTAQVLAGVPFSNETDTGLIGAMPNRGSVELKILRLKTKSM